MIEHNVHVCVHACVSVHTTEHNTKQNEPLRKTKRRHMTATSREVISGFLVPVFFPILSRGAFSIYYLQVIALCEQLSLLLPCFQ